MRVYRTPQLVILLAITLIAVASSACATRSEPFPRAELSSPITVQWSNEPPDIADLARSTTVPTMYRQFRGAIPLLPLICTPCIFLNDALIRSKTRKEWARMESSFADIDIAKMVEEARWDRVPIATAQVSPAPITSIVIARPFLLLREDPDRSIHSLIAIQAEIRGQDEKVQWSNVYSYHLPIVLSATALPSNQDESGRAYRNQVEAGTRQVLELFRREIEGDLRWEDARPALVKSPAFYGSTTFPLNVSIIEDRPDVKIVRFDFQGLVGITGYHIVETSAVESLELLKP